MGRWIRRLMAFLALASLCSTAGISGMTAVGARGASLTQGATPISMAPASVPKSFEATSMSWITSSEGWILGKASCGKSTCSDIVGTSNGGKTWTVLGKFPAPLSSIQDTPTPGVSEIRMATSKVGWIFGSGLFRTTDGGQTWTKVANPGTGKQVLAVAAGPSMTYALMSPCPWQTGMCNHKPLSLWRTNTTTAHTWTQISIKLPMSVDSGLSLFGKTVYVFDTQFGPPDRLYASTDGVHFSARPVPCDKTDDVQLVQAVAVSATDVDLLCDGNPGFSKAEKFVYRSTDTGKTTTNAGTMGVYGIEAQLTASPSGNLAVASWSDGSFIYTNDGGKSKWNMTVAYSDGGAGWNDVQYVSNTEAWVVYAPAGFFHGIGKIYVTRDSGKTWKLENM